jgi:hypothetical protein
VRRWRWFLRLSRIQAGYGGGADVVQPGRGGADDDDLAGELTHVAQRFLARLVGIQFTVGDVFERTIIAAPVQGDVRLLGDGIAEIAHHARG